MSDHKNYESECDSDLDKDDNIVLTRRYSKFIQKLADSKKKVGGKVKLKAQWTKMHDAVQEHFSSHVLINNTSHLLPSNVYALKQASKQSWMLYKKRECERRKRLRIKIEKEKEVECSGGPANLLLSLVDACEACKKMYITVNLFWGVTLCDVCYFNTEVIMDIMKAKTNMLFSTSKIFGEKEDSKKKFFTVTPNVVPTVELVDNLYENVDIVDPTEIHVDLRVESTYETPHEKSEESNEKDWEDIRDLCKSLEAEISDGDFAI